MPITRATVIRSDPFASADQADAWLKEVKEDEEEVGQALRLLNRALHSHRVARADPHVAEVSAERSLAVRVGYGSGEEVAEGRFSSAWELGDRGPRARRRSMEAPDERFAALLGGREQALPAEELVLRARADLDAGRTAEAALQARVALESLLAGIGDDVRRHELEDDRGPIGNAANQALKGALRPEQTAAVREAVERMEAALRRRRLKG